MFSVIPLRLGLAVVLVYFGIMSWLQPTVWLETWPALALEVLSLEPIIFIRTAAIVQIVVAFGLMMRPFMRFAFPLATLLLFLIAGSAVYLRLWDVAVRDFAILTMAFYGTWRSWTG